MSSIDEILSKYKWNKRTNKIDFDFKIIEEQIGFPLPQDYKNYLIQYCENENLIGQEYVRLWSVENLLEWNLDFQIFEFLPKTIAIGDNGNGEFIGIEFTQDYKYEIILSTFTDLDPEYNIQIGKSFTDFIEKLNKGETWFNEK
ncbi:SMI1/KNR4 family protein [Chryseobacterium schmidteae]|uniref:SMI1/KNR4 family protein n=1 Tax=Chryseobacterium schmidteae TaxID=2730404 RepID=UPI00158BEA4A|nr:SMI1/KNR4 family protein [Chryseobacterium schmidteae]